MDWVIFTIFIVVFSYSVPSLASIEKNFSVTFMKKDEKPGIYIEYKRIQDELCRKYQKVRDQIINGHLARNLQVSYEELKLLEKSLMDKYIEERREFLEKYLNRDKNTN